ncbi:hypothetical protein CRE_12043 [Caenorhabditis remanei]|uniref:DUF38 domain-containing protein n=1 Tax=Caenorhabditis remanei TaxID=31234 RepID=E3MPX8_CAERE|nr:hypothetical protein CRE_12043 [Caenorhabditis remanei]
MKCVKEDAENEFSHALHTLGVDIIIVLESLQRHMRDLFRFKPRVQLELASPHFINMYRLIDDVADTSFDVDELDTEELENHLTIFPVQDSVHLKAKLTGPLLTSDSKLCSIKGLGFQRTRDDGVIDPFILNETHQNPRLHFSEVINNFGGEYLVLVGIVYNINDWAQLIRRWKSKQAYQNLKFIATTAPTGIAIMFEHAMQQFDFVEWDGQRRPGTVTLDPKIINLLSNSFENIDCSKWVDIQQDGDGKWASIMLSETSIRFLVWD